MKDINKIISNFKKGVADALFRGKENNPNNLDYYRQGYDYGIFLYSEINEEEKTHPHLIRWHALPESVRIVDNNLPSMFISLLGHKGYGIHQK